MKTQPSTAAGRRLPATPGDLEARALRLWPDGEPCAERNRREWIRAVCMVRATRGGWVADLRAQGVAS